MRSRFLILLFLFFSVTAKSQPFFKVIETKRIDLHGLKNTDNKVSKWFRIVSNRDKNRINGLYPIILPKDIDTLKAIEELLTYEGDRRPCALPLMNYNPARSQIYMSKDSIYSIQVEALFIINQLVYSKPFNYAAYPILVDTRTNKTYCIGGNVIHKAFNAYRKWYLQLKGKSIANMNEKSKMPLDGSTIRWF
jgi:hypothetical protein